MKVLFITTSSLASNPRLIKEIELATENSFEISVVYFKINGWGEDLSKKIKDNFVNIQFYEISATRSPFFSWLFSSLIEFFLRKIPKRFLSTKFLAYSINKRTYLLNKKLSEFTKSFDWIIAHNPGSFFPAYKFSKRNGAKLGLDLEDYHPGETTDFKESQRMLKMMKLILPKATYCSFAAPLIQREFEKIISNKSKKWFTILNGFSQNEFNEPKQNNAQKLKMVWFSQNISPGRGLEKFISVINSLHKEIELHLIGNLSEENRGLLLNNEKGIIIHKPMSQKKLHQFIGGFDIGLVADPPINKNREIAITNKLIAYAQAGLFIVSVSSFGHNDLLNNSQLKFQIINYSEEEIYYYLKKILNEFKIMGFKKIDQFNYAKKYSWEEINSPLIEIWKS